MKTSVTYSQALLRASSRLQKKIEYSVQLLRKAESIALSYDARGGITSLFLAARILRLFITSPRLLALNSRLT